MVATLGFAFAPPALATAAPGPDLQVRAVSSPSSQEAPGSRLLARVTVRNAGDRRAAPSRVGFYLSRDRRKGRGDFRLRPRPRLGARRPRSRARLLRTLTVPRGVPTGNFALVACADDTRRVRERRERNNCRSARRRIRIVAPRPPVLPVPVTPPAFVIAAPSLQLTGIPSGTVTFDTTPTYSGTARSGVPVARVEARIDGGAFSTAGVTCSGCGTTAASWTFTSPPLADGPHSLSFRAVDFLNRTTQTITRTLTVDTVPPTFGSIAAAQGSTAVTAAFSEPLACGTVNAFDFTAEINNVAVNVDNAVCGPSGTSVTLTLASAPGAGATVEVTISGVISDVAGNVVPVDTTRSDGT